MEAVQGATRDRLPATSRAWWHLVPALLVGMALLLTAAGNRWGSYILSPIPGIYLADLLLTLGALGGVLFVARLRLARWVVMTYGAVWAYVIVVLVPEFLVIPVSDRYLAVRDAAPFLYLVLIPGLAMALTPIAARSAIVVMRIVTVLAAVGPLVAQATGVSFESSALGSEYVAFLHFRTDLTGAVIAIGVIAWSAWPQLGVKPVLGVQIGLLLCAGLVITSRSGLVAVVISTVVLVWLQDHGRKRIVVAGLALGSLVLGMLLGPYLGPSIFGGRSQSDSSQSDSSQSDSSQSDSSQSDWVVDPSAEDVSRGPSWITMAERSGTVGARLDTWASVLEGLTAHGTWLVGGAAGSDYLYELCTGLTQAPPVLLTARDGPKCAVDDYGPEPVVRDPHNWILNISVTHGALGVLVFILVLAVTWWRGRGSEAFRLSSWTIGFFLISGMTFLISAGYALVPIAVAAAWIVSRSGVTPRQKGSDEPTVELT